MIGNGVCNDEANNDNCKYDGGDCCHEISYPDKCKHAETCTSGKRQIHISQVVSKYYKFWKKNAHPC